MTPTEIVSRLDVRFGQRIKDRKLDAIDPYVVVAPEDLLKVCEYLRDDPKLRFEILNCISGVDYLEPDTKKVAKAGFEPHTEVVYHVSSFTLRHRFVFKVI